MLSFFGRTSQVLSIIFLSFVFGAILMALTAYYSASWFNDILDSASDLKDWLSNDWLPIWFPLEVNVWFKFLLKDEALVLMFFTMAARVILYLGFALFNTVMSAFRAPTLSKYEVRALQDENDKLKEELARLTGNVKGAAAKVEDAARNTIGRLG